MAKKILFLVNITLDELESKGVQGMILERDESGYFDHVYTAHFPAFKSRTVRLNDKHTVIEIQGKTANSLFKKTGLGYLLFVLKMPYALWRLARLIKKEDIDIIRSIDPFHMGAMAFILSRMTRKPWCVSIHADHDLRFRLNGRQGFSLAALEAMRRFTLKRADLIMPIRESLKDGLIRNGANALKIRVIPHGIDLRPFDKNASQQLRKELGINNEKLVVFAGRLRRENYVYDIVEIAVLLAQKRNDIRFLMIGGGDEETSLKEMVLQRGVSRSFIFAGFQPRDKAIEFRKLADVNLCLMGGYSLLEAAASGRPVVSYDVEWHYEIVQDGRTGILLKEHDTSGAACAIEKLVDDSTLSDKLGSAAKALVYGGYSLEAASKSKIKCYEELFAILKERAAKGRERWYVDDQVRASQKPHMRRLFNDRMDFLSRSIDAYAASRGKQGAVRILDAGCGDGAVMSALSGKPGVEIYGMDYNPLRIGRVKGRASNVRVAQADVTKPCFKDESFDIVILNQVLEHIAEDEGALKAVRKLLKKDGVLIFGVPNEGCLMARLRNKYLQPSISKTTDHVHFYTKDELLRKLRNCGYSVKNMRAEGFFVPHYLAWAAISSSYIGYKMLDMLGKVFSSEACGFYFICQRDGI